MPAPPPRPMNVLLNGPIARQGAALLRSRFGDGLQIVEVADPAASAAAFATAEVLVTVELGSGLPPMPKLRLIQLPAAGLDAVDLDAVPAGCRVCNTFEHEIGISEYVLAAMLHWTVGLAGRDARFRAGSWADSPRLLAPAARSARQDRGLRRLRPHRPGGGGPRPGVRHARHGDRRQAAAARAGARLAGRTGRSSRTCSRPRISS